MSNEYTKQQIRNWLERAIEKAQNPDPREVIRRERKKRMEKVAARYGL